MLEIIKTVLALLVCVQIAQAQAEKKSKSAFDPGRGFTVLFDGTNMDAWVGNKTAYTIEDGTMAVDPTKGGGGNIYTKKEYSDFIFRFEFRLTEGANNGVGIRTPTQGDAAYQGMEIQILQHQ